MLRGLFREIVLVDADLALARAEASDLSDADALARPTRIWAGDYSDAAEARIAVVTAGAATHGSASRLSVAVESAATVSACVAALATAGFRGIIVVASNPVDLMTHIAFRTADLPAGQVLGTGTLLDSSRFRQALAQRLDVAPGAVEALVLGEHGDSEVAAFSTVRVGGLVLEDFGSWSAARSAAVAAEVRDRGYAIIAGKGHTSFGIATAIVRICEAIIRDERSVLPLSVQLLGQFGLSNVFLSLPCVLGQNGIEQILSPMLTETEIAALQASAATVREAFERLPG